MNQIACEKSTLTEIHIARAPDVSTTCYHLGPENSCEVFDSSSSSTCFAWMTLPKAVSSSAGRTNRRAVIKPKVEEDTTYGGLAARVDERRSLKLSLLAPYVRTHVRRRTQTAILRGGKS